MLDFGICESIEGCEALEESTPTTATEMTGSLSATEEKTAAPPPPPATGEGEEATMPTVERWRESRAGS
ncbi:hypothetical protein ON010_g8380 [Phytophthora cinnamomi]|nr:hypothetical protein ON010_g8380 [Phytophthora cinnamomi]